MYVCVYIYIYIHIYTYIKRETPAHQNGSKPKWRSETALKEASALYFYGRTTVLARAQILPPLYSHGI